LLGGCILERRNIFLGIFGILLIVLMVSGCTSTAQKETVMFDKNIGGSTLTVQY